jgi:hypothetical protein
VAFNRLPGGGVLRVCRPKAAHVEPDLEMSNALNSPRCHTGREQMQQIAPLFDHLVGERE